MAENKIFMDTDKFTEIVGEIESAAKECVFPERAIENKLAWEKTNVGREIISILTEIHKTADMYNAEASGNLPRGFLTLRDSMIAIDKVASESLTVEIDMR